jgi:TolB protein
MSRLLAELTHRRALLRCCLLPSLLLALTAPPTAAQEEPIAPGATGQEVVVELEPGQRPRLRLAMPGAVRPAAAPPEARRAMDELEQTLRDDLEVTGVFTVQGPDVLSVLELTGDRERDFVLYRSLDNEVVLINELKLEGDRLVLEGRVYDLKSGRFIFGKRYAGTYDLARRIAHTFNDEIVLYFTGREGIARTQIAFSSDRDGEGLKEIYLMDYDGANQRRVTGHESLTLAPVWSPRGDVLAYISYYQGGPSIFAADIETGAKSPILVDDVSTFSPTFAPDGERLAFTRSVEGNLEIFAARRDGSDLRRLTNSNGIDTNPAWSPSGREIAFSSSRSGSPQLYLMDAEGSNVRRVTFEGNYNEGAAWHPDGTKIAFSHRNRRGNRFDVAVLDLVTLEMRLVTDGLSGSHEAPSFSPDGRHLVFESSHRDGRQLFRIDVDGRNLRQLTNVGSNFGPAWSNQLD